MSSFLLEAAGIRSLIQDKDNPKKKTSKQHEQKPNSIVLFEQDVGEKKNIMDQSIRI